MPADQAGCDQIGRHPRRVGELGIVVISQNLIEVAGGRAMRINMRMRVEDRPARQFVEQLFRLRVKWSHHAAGERHRERLERGYCP